MNSLRGMNNSSVRLWMSAAVISGAFVAVLELSTRHHASNKLAIQLGGAVLLWLLLTVAGALATIWGRGHRPVGWSRIVLSLVVSLDVWVPVGLYPRHADPRPVGRAFSILIIVLLSAATIWATLWGATWLLQRARPRGVGRRELLGTWATSLTVAGAVSVLLALHPTGFDSHHIVLLIGLSVFIWLAISLALDVLLALVWSLHTRNRAQHLSA
jgi:hypothetical protein